MRPGRRARAAAPTGAGDMREALRRAPFSLSAADLDWVTATLDRMTTAQRLAQLFVLEQAVCTAERRRGPVEDAGGYFFQGMDDLDAHRAAVRQLSGDCRVPPLLCSDLEGGHYGSPLMTPTPNSLALAACDDLEISAAVAAVLAAEARALGLNWSFTPQVDLALNPRNPVVGTRSYGDEVDRVVRQARCHVDVLRRAGIATTAKHWPGDGVDDRDQHLVTSVNGLDEAAWRERYGSVYRELIAAGVLAVMAGHIALPWRARAAGARGREVHRPASISSTLIDDLLRGEFGFNGLVVSDASTMAGLAGWDRRDRLLPELVAQGCDIVLFSDDLAADIASLSRALDDGRLAPARVDAAVLRVLAMKAALGLHRTDAGRAGAPGEAVLGAPAHRAAVARAARASITVVKDAVGGLPLDPARHRRLAVFVEAERVRFPGLQRRDFGPLLAALAGAGFEPRMHVAGAPMPSPADTDLVLYLVGLEATPTLETIGIDWAALHGDALAAMHRTWHELPTVMVSFGHPYGLLQAPDVPTYLNAYAATVPQQAAVVDVLLGRCAATGRSPIDCTGGSGQGLD